MRKIRNHSFMAATILLIGMILSGTTGVLQCEPRQIWSMDTPQDIAGIENDNTGAKFTLVADPVCQGAAALAVTPNGQAAETKIALPLAGERITWWSESRTLVVNYYFPETMARKPSMFFLGLADWTGGFSWIDGVFAKPQLQPGWNQVRYDLTAGMRNLNPSHSYKVYLALAAQDADRKPPLLERFYIDGIYGENSAAATQDQLLAKVSAQTKEEVASLLALNTEGLLEAVERKTFAYFWNEANPENGLIRDRSTPSSTCSIAAVGFGLTAIPVAIERGWVKKEEGYGRVLTTLKTFAGGGVEGKNGFFYHWVYMADGRRAGSELSSIDTALFIAGALFCGEYFKGTEVESLAAKLYAAVDWQWMTNGGDTLCMEWVPERGGFTPPRWNAFNEGLLATLLAMGSPTRPIPAKGWSAVMRPVKDNYIRITTENLFVYQYPLCWFDLRDKEDHYANYFNNAAAATKYNRLFSLGERGNYRTYAEDIWGLSAGDGPGGYKAYGASNGNHDGTIVPYAALASMPFTPDLSQAALIGLLRKYGPLIWGKYGFVSGFNADQNWYSSEYIGIDQGDILLMLENYRTGLIWKYFMRNTGVQQALRLAGFTVRKADYAATPQFLKEIDQQAQAPAQKSAQAGTISQPMTIDGDLADWQGSMFNLVDETMNVPDPGLTPIDPAKTRLRSSFSAAWDAEHLYLAAEVTDDAIVSNLAAGDRSAFYRTDSIEFYLDPSRARSTAGLLKLAILPFDQAGQVQAIRHEDAKPGPIEKSAPGVRVASKRTATGYVIEVAIPFKLLGLTPASGLQIGFCHAVHNTNNTKAGTGAYARENMIAWNNVPEVWNNPQRWGTLVLE